MFSIVECSPNFSEGRRQEVIDAIVDAIRGGGVCVLEVQADADQNRAAVRFAGSPEAVERAALAGVAVAAARIDLTQHTGTHPRIGAVDVVPFAPVAEATVDDCVKLARRVGEAIAAQLELPVYLYAEAALRPDRRDLTAIRDGEYEALRDAIATDPARAPDFGPSRIGPAGAVAVGARHPQVRCAVWLHPPDDAVADAVARAVDRHTGGFGHVEAKRFDGAEEGAGVMFTVARPDLIPLPRIVDAAEREAARHGARISGTRIIGPVAQSVLLQAAAWPLKLAALAPEQIIENHLIGGAPCAGAGRDEATPRAFVERVAADSATPGGGSVAALAGALAAALTAMVAGLTIGRQRYAEVEETMEQLRARAAELQAALLDLIATDSAAFDAVMDAYKLPRGTADTANARRDAVQVALRAATEVPLEVLRRSVGVLRAVHTAAELGNASAISDAGVAGYLAFAAAQSAALNIEINIMGLRNLEDGDRYRRESAELLREARQLADGIDRTAHARIAGNP